VGCEAAAVVGEPLRRLRRSERGEAAFDGEQHEVACGDAADPTRAGGPGQDLAVVGVDGEGDLDSVAVPARDLEHIGLQRRFEAAVATSPSGGRCRPRPVCGASSSPARFITRYTHLSSNRCQPWSGAKGSLSSTRSAVPPSPWRQIVGSPNVIHAVD
jgi:hypothetical protein